ncbi:MAG: PASTA domain-containing protein [Lawsonella clevelandensis]
MSLPKPSPVSASSPDQLAVPDVTNLKANDATDRLRQQGLRVDLRTEASNTVPRGMAIRTDPAASTMVARGGRVTLVLCPPVRDPLWCRMCKAWRRGRP